MTLKGVIGPPYDGLSSTYLNGQGGFTIPPGSGGGAGTVTSVGLSAPTEFAVSGNPVTAAGTLAFGYIGPTAVAHGGTGAATLGSNAIVATGLTSTAAFTSILMNQMTSSFLNGNGAFSFLPSVAGGSGTVTSVGLSAPAEFAVSGSPVTTSGTLAVGFIAPIAVAHGGSGMGSFAASSIIQAGLGSSAKFQSIPLTNLTSEVLAGSGAFAVPPPQPIFPNNTTTFLRGDRTFAAPGGSDPWIYATLGSDFTRSLTSSADVSINGVILGFAPAANTKYEFYARLMLKTATASVNPRVGLAWPTGMKDSVAMIIEAQAATGTPLFASGNQNASLLVAVGGLPNSTQAWPAEMRGMALSSEAPSGNIRVQLASETAGTLVRVEAGSFLRYRSY